VGGILERNKGQRIVVVVVVFFVCLFADGLLPAGALRVNSRLFWSQSNKYVVQSKIAEIADFCMAGWQVLSHSLQKIGTTDVF